MTEVEKARICHPSAILTASQPEDGSPSRVRP